MLYRMVTLPVLLRRGCGRGGRGMRGATAYGEGEQKHRTAHQGPADDHRHQRRHVRIGLRLRRSAFR